MAKHLYCTYEKKDGSLCGSSTGRIPGERCSKHSKKLFPSRNNAIPIQYMLQIPIIKVDLRDNNGNEIKDIVQVTHFGGGIIVATKDGLYTDKPELFTGFTPTKTKLLSGHL